MREEKAGLSEEKPLLSEKAEDGEPMQPYVLNAVIGIIASKTTRKRYNGSVKPPSRGIAARKTTSVSAITTGRE